MALEDITRATLAEASVDSQQRQLGQLDPDMPAVPASSRRMRTRVDSTSDALALADNKENFNLGLPRSPVARITKRKISLTSSGWSAPALAPTSIPGGALDSATTALPAPTTAKRARYTTNPPSSAYERLCAATRRSSRQHAHVRARAAMMMMAGPAGSATGKTVIPLRSAVAGDNGMVNLVTPSPVRPGEMSGAATVAALASNGARVPPAPLLLATHAHRTPLSPDLSSPPCSPIRRSSRLLALARTDTDDDESGDGGESDDDDDELARVQKEARERTMLAYAPGGGGRGRMRGAGAGVGFGAMRGAVLRGAGAGSAAARSAMLGLNTTPAYLSTFASHLSLADYRVTPNIDHPTHAVKDWSPAYTCAYSQAARSGEGPSILALGTESGSIKLVDTNVDAVTQAANGAGMTYAAHRNAVFDVKWSPDDKQLLTASADMTCAVYDLASSRVVASLRGHAGSVKTAVWFDPNVVVSGARDGHIFIYDLRAPGELAATPAVGRRRRGAANDDGVRNPVMSIQNAHTDPTKSKMRTTPKSMTCLLALKSQPGMLASTSAADGVVKLWDVRGGLANSRKDSISKAGGQTLDRSTEHGKRPRGANWMVEGNGNIYTLGGDSRIHAHSIAQPDLPLPISYAHPSLRVTTFYVKLAMSPCERYLACGSSHGAVYAWELGQNTRCNISRGAGGDLGQSSTVEGVELGWNGHAREAGAIDWGYDQLVSCSDDYTNRVWRPNRQATNLIRTNPTEAAWHWSGVRSTT